MPSTSAKQHRFMEAVAHNEEFAEKVGVKQSVGKDFADADDAAGITKTHNGKPAKPHTPNQIKFFHSKGFEPKGGIRHPSNGGMSLEGGGKGTRPTQ